MQNKKYVITAVLLLKTEICGDKKKTFVDHEVVSAA